jgi:hypothetical protein
MILKPYHMIRSAIANSSLSRGKNHPIVHGSEEVRCLEVFYLGFHNVAQFLYIHLPRLLRFLGVLHSELSLDRFFLTFDKLPQCRFNELSLPKMIWICNCHVRFQSNRKQERKRSHKALKISLQRYGNNRNPSNHNNYESGCCNDCLQAHRIHLHSFEGFMMLLS